MELQTLHSLRKIINVTCNLCNNTVSGDETYINAGINLCIRGTNCGNLEEVAKKICAFIGYRFISITRTKDKPTVVNFECNNGHIWHCIYPTFREGSRCTKCHNTRNPRKLYNAKDRDCSCRSKWNKRPLACEHFNHATICPKSAIYLSSNNKDLLILTKVGPKSLIILLWDCPRCGKEFSQTPSARAYKNTFYCSDECKITPGKDFLSLYPQIVNFVDEDNNEVILNQVSCISAEKVALVCYEHDEIRRWKSKVGNIVRSLNRLILTDIGTPCCEECHSKGYNQKYGGHEHFVEIANKRHGNIYDYPEQYESNSKKIKIFCRVKDHGIFEKTPGDHKRGYGCWRCTAERKESKACQRLRELLLENNISFTTEEIFPGLVNINSLRVDFYTEKYNDILINLVKEVDGRQHFWTSGWCDEENLKGIKFRDKLKDAYCLKNGYNMWRIPFLEVVTDEKLAMMLDLCSPGNKQVYASYPEYIEEMSKYFDLSQVNVIIVQPPTQKSKRD